MNVLGEALRRADRADQRRGRHLIRAILRGDVVKATDLDTVVTVARLQRKALRDVTVADMVAMGLIKAVA